MRAGRQWGLVLVFSVCGLVWAQSVSANDAAAIYDPSRMYVVKLHLPEESRKELAKDRDKYQPGTFSLAESADGTPGSVGTFSDPVSIDLKLKGSASYRPLSGKSAFKIRFREAQPFRGLHYMTLNNMVEDPSMIHETLAYTAFRGAGVSASRTGYAYVYVDGEDYGVHLNIEALDKIALEKRFGPFEATQHLYEGEGGAEVRPGGLNGFEIDEGGADRSDLEALIEAVDSDGPQSWASRVAAAADLQEMTRMWAVEKYIGQWDGYAGRDGETWLPNNYYLYSDPSGKFQMLPWGNDESWQEAYHLPFDGPAGLMFNRCLEDAVCAGIYRESVAAVRDAIAGMGLDALAVNTADLLAPWQALEAEESTREEHSLAAIQDKVAETRTFIATRPRDAAEWLGELPGSEADRPDASTAPQVLRKLFGLQHPRLRVSRAWVKGGVLRAEVHPWARGIVTMHAKIATREGAVVVCEDRARVKGAQSLTLSCRLPAGVRERLGRGSFGITVATRFLPAGGRPEQVTRRIGSPRG